MNVRTAEHLDFNEFMPMLMETMILAMNNNEYSLFKGYNDKIFEALTTNVKM